MSITIESFGANGTTMQLDTDHSSSWLANIFQPYVMPFTGDGNDELVDDHLDWRFLGVCSLKSKTYGLMDVAFFQISSNSEDKTRMGTMIVDDSFTPTPSTTNPLISCIATGDTTSSSPNNSDTTESNHSDEYPRSNNCKRIIVMSSDTQAIKFSSHQAYYIFPSDAIVETVNDSAPYEVFCSFHVMVPNQQRQLGYVIDPSDHVSNNMSPLDNQRCYTNSPSSSLLLETMPDIKMEQTTSSVTIDGSLIIHLSISGLSKELYSNIKETVAGFETTYGKMIQLMKLHTEGVSHRQAELQILDGNHASRTKKVTSDLKTTKNKRKGSQSQRQTSPRATTSSITNITTATTPIDSTLSNKVKLANGNMDTMNPPSISPKQASISSPSSSRTSTLTTLTNSTTASVTTTSSSTTHRNNTSNGNGRKCSYCGSKTTPMWRRGPEGAGTLCNACGVKWKHGKILCGKTSSSASGPTSAPASMKSSTNNISMITKEQQKKRKQNGELKLKKDKRIKVKEQQQQQQRQLQQQQQRQQRQQRNQHWHGNETTTDNTMVTTEEEDIDDEDEEDGDFSYEDEFMDYNEDNNNDDDDDDNDEDDEDDDMLDEDERMKHNIVAARHLTIHESQRQDNTFYANPPFLSSSPPTPHSRSRSMTTSNAANYIPYQYQRQQSQQSPEEWPLSAGFQETTYYHHQSENQQQRPRRHTADVSVLDRVPWGEFPLSMGVDAVEAATVLTLLKRS